MEKLATVLMAATFVVLAGSLLSEGEQYRGGAVAAKPAEGQWVEMLPALYPSARVLSNAAYDSGADKLILYGGMFASVDSMETWAYDYQTNTWVDMAPGAHPPMLHAFAMAYDSESDRVILFGGRSWEPFHGGTWAYDYHANLWTNMAPSQSPPAADAVQMVYDSHSDRIILFGGYTSNAYTTSNQTWAYDYNSNTWTNRNPAPGPSGRGGFSMAYDSAADRVILFGGSTSMYDWAYNDTWAYDYETNAWTNRTPAVAPSPRDVAGMAYDSSAGQVILVGGSKSDWTKTNETWAYDYSANNWTLLHPATRPASRWYSYIAYDSQSGRSILFGGLTDVDASNETWSYRLSPGAPSPPSRFASSAGDGSVQLTWQPPLDDGGAQVTHYSVYRGTTPAAVGLLAEVGNVLAYMDASATNGVTYYYQVTASNTFGEGARAGEISASPTTLPDTTPPVLTIAEPANNSVYGHLAWTIAGTASDDVAVAKVEVSVDGTTWITATGTTSWSVTVTLVPGGNTIYVRATDTAGNTVLHTIHVEVDVPPASGVPLWVWPLAGVGIAGVLAAAYVTLRWRAKRAE